MWLWNSKVSLLRAQAALGAAFHRKGDTAFPKGKWPAWHGKSKTKAWGNKGTRIDGHRGEYLHIGRCIQIKQEKCFHVGNTAVRLQGWEVLPAGKTHYSNFYSTSAEHRKKLWSTRSQIHRGLGTVIRSLLSKTAPMHWENHCRKAGKSTPLDSTSELPVSENSMQDVKGGVCASIPPRAGLRTGFDVAADSRRTLSHALGPAFDPVQLAGKGNVNGIQKCLKSLFCYSN